MHFSGNYMVTKVCQLHSGGKTRTVTLTPQHDHSGKTPDGYIELLVSDPDLVPEFAVDSVHSVTISPVVPVVRAAQPAGLIANEGTEDPARVERGDRVVDTPSTVYDAPSTKATRRER